MSGLSKIIGQAQVISQLRALALLCKNTKAIKLLFIGQDGVGKSTVAGAFAEEVGRDYDIPRYLL